MLAERRLSSGLLSKIEFETRVEHPLARELVVERERVQFVVLVGDVQHADSRLSVTPPETVSGEGVELPKLVTAQSRRVAIVVLRCPQRFALGEETAREIIKG